MPLAVALSLLLAASAGFAGELHRYALILNGPPAAADARSRKDLRQQRISSVVGARQTAVLKALAEQQIEVTAADPLLTNAVFIRATEETVNQLRRLPSVAFVERLRPLRRHLNSALDLSGVPSAWVTVGGAVNAGAGVRIAVIDSGIDISHPAFNDTGFQYPPGFPKCASECAYVNRKVIVARSYVDMLISSDPAESRPDDLSPRDRVGHGTGVAMIAAGRPSDSPLGRVQGVAPAAWLGSYKIFGSPGVNDDFTYDDVLIWALTDALEDGMDVAIVSLGAPAVWGPRDAGTVCDLPETRACDWRAEAIEHASRLGLTVVVSAGDSGRDGYNSIESPGTAPAAITVGAISNAQRLYQSLASLNVLFGDGPRPDASITAQVREIATGCGPVGSADLNGVFVMLPRGDCQPAITIQNAQRAGAIGVILYQPEGTEDIYPMRGLQETGIPAVLMGATDAAALKGRLAANPNALVTMDPGFSSVQATERDQVATFSSRGPSIREFGIKPELVAVGTDIYTATQSYDPNGNLYHPTGYTAVRGTSFAVPLVAGTVALVKQRNPNFTPAQLKSAVVNTADPGVRSADGEATVFDTGAGKLDAGKAVSTDVTVEPSTLSVGASAPRSLKLCNHSTGALNLRLTSAPDLTISDTNFTLNARSCRDGVSIRLEDSRLTPGVYDGAIQVTGGAVALRVPYVHVVRDGTPSKILLLEGDGFESEPGRVVTLTFKVVDRFGVPVANQTVQLQAITGGGSIRRQANTTDDLGIGWADVVVGPQLGEQRYSVTAGNLAASFRGRARLAPAIATGGVVNAASGEAGRGFAPGSFISIFGHGLSEVTRVFSTPYLPLSLAGVSVSFDHLPARIHFVSDSQINVQIPWELEGFSTARMKVSLGLSSSALVNVPIASQSPALFEYTDSGGHRLAAAVTDTGVVSPSNPVPPGRVVSLYANGLGPVDNQPASGNAAPSALLVLTRATPVVTIGGRPAQVQFSGLAPGFVGLYQVNVRIPTDILPGLQPVVITAGGITSNEAHLPIAAALP